MIIRIEMTKKYTFAIRRNCSNMDLGSQVIAVNLVVEMELLVQIEFSIEESVFTCRIHGG